MGLLREAGQLVAGHQLVGRRTLGWQQAVASASFRSACSFQRPALSAGKVMNTHLLMGCWMNYNIIYFIWNMTKNPNICQYGVVCLQRNPGQPLKRARCVCIDKWENSLYNNRDHKNICIYTQVRQVHTRHSFQTAAYQKWLWEGRAYQKTHRACCVILWCQSFSQGTLYLRSAKIKI